ncbi:chemotaxis protein [Thiorhodococcus mannitoliphagus]|uniref:Chemotaxis protein n=1 Tax=Thiorhodococcus mannitoliphagus TaxID=329406 RepID=A0A6P1DTY4_9GAMM|nr:methyl-accepting chemotaxis protein [Thiorhodococcus mannitoliphagus]NEX20643.1 chemotaxis protein [Thiorhodococcus mannitoliphagus]
MISFNRMRVSTRLATAGVTVLIGLALIAGYTLMSIKSDALAAHRERLSDLVEVAAGVVATYQTLENEKVLSREEAQRQAKDALRPLRFSGADYFFVFDFEGRAVVSANPDYEGKGFLGKTDAAGFKLWDAIVEKGKAGEGYIDYVYPRPGQTKSEPKLAYVVGIPEWQWILGTGVYIDDVDKVVAKEAIRYGLISFLILVVVALIGFLVARSILTQLGGEPLDAAASLKKIAQGDLSEDIALASGDTTSLLAALKQMQESLVRLVGEIAEVVHASTNGDFSQRIDLSDKQGFGRKIGSELNHLVETTEVGLNDATRVANALAVGDLSQSITRDYPGSFDQMKIGVNGTVAALTEVVTEIRRLVDAAGRGDFSMRLEVAGKQGFGKDIAQLLNELSDTTDVGLKDVIRVVKAMGDGDLTQSITKEYPGLFGETTSGVNATLGRLKELIGQIQESAGTINTAAREIASGNSDLSQRTEEQASSLEETASSMEELTSTVKQNADNARQANLLASGARDAATQGGERVNEAVNSMQAITESAEKISNIISVIDGIAFQTNILALNAAVEAARAGEQGRGFAVVAAEVRSLAQRSAAAAKEIKALIQEDEAAILAGSKLVREAGESMGEIVSQVKRVSDLIAEISAASDEQTSGIEQVNQAIIQMDDVTQQNASLVEEAAAAAESLEEQSQQLARVVRAFNVDQAAGAASLETAPKPPTSAREPRSPQAVSTPRGSAGRRVTAVRKAAVVVPAQLQGTEDEWEEF